MLERLPEEQRKTLFIKRPELAGYSAIAYLPVTSPEIPLHSIQNNGKEKLGVKVGNVIIGGPEIIVMAGLCSLENYDQMYQAATAAKNSGAKILRGGAFKPRTSPYSFQGRGKEALVEQRYIADELGMLVVTEATGLLNLPLVAEYADIIQIGARNSQNFELLAASGLMASDMDKAVLHKRGPAMSVREWLYAAEYILAAGCEKVILCERGTKLPNGSYGADLEALQEAKKLTHLPIIVDPTHSSTNYTQVPKTALSAISTGADGLLIEIHTNPSEALCDKDRAILPTTLKEVTDLIDRYCPQGRYYRAPVLQESCI